MLVLLSLFAMATRFAMRGRVALIQITKPPVNSLGLAVRQGLWDGLDAAEKSGAGAVVIAGDGNTFPAGADISEFASGGHLTEPDLNALIDRLERVTIPTVAAIHGTALGGGLELALGCHWRLMHEKAKAGLPEVHLGILPGAGGTQRLPRLTGCQPAIEMITSGRPVNAKKALALGIADEVVSGGASPAEAVAERAVAFAEGLVDKPIEPSRVVSDRVVADPGAAFWPEARKAVAKAARGFEAPLAIVEAVAASVSAPSFAEGMEEERRLFAGLAMGTQAPALQHVFFAERQISKVKGPLGEAKPAPIKSAAVVGSGTMGGGIAMCFADRGVPVTLIDTSDEALARGVGIIRKNYEATAKKGRLTAEQVEQRMGLITPTTEYAHEGVASADIVVEAAFERMVVKKEIFKALDKHCKPGAVLASNTSTLDIDEIASATSRPASVVGTHFFSPANVMPLLENVAGESASPQTVATAMGLGKLLGKKAVLARNCFGFIGNRMLEPYAQQDSKLPGASSMSGSFPAPSLSLG